MIQILETDKLFTDSPDTGDIDCLCSRCGKQINESECPLRCWPTDQTTGQPDNSEYRFCEKCMFSAGITPYYGEEFDEIYGHHE